MLRELERTSVELEVNDPCVENPGESRDLPDSESWEGKSENASYSLAIQPYNDGRDDEIRGGTITALSIQEDDSAPVDNSSAMAYYMGREAISVFVSHHNVDLLAQYNQSDREGEPPDTYTFEAYHAPFPELPQDEDGEIGDGVYRVGERLLYHRSARDAVSLDESVSTIDLPLRVDADVQMFLHKDGKPNHAADNEHQDEPDSDGINLSEEDIPPKYSTSFYTSVMRNSSRQ